ncbi:MAG: MFS transporter [Gammaproteobacteria bacterium]
MSDGLHGTQRALAFLAVAIAVTMAVLDTSIVNIALPTLAQELAVTPSQAVWVVNAYQMAVTVCLLPLAVLGDQVGYKRVYGWGLALFALASIACAAAPTLALLACARAIQGVGAAGIMSVNMALVRAIFPKAQLGAGMGYAAMVVSSASLAGPTVAAGILTMASWHWLFLVNVPLGALALLIGSRALPASPTRPFRLDLAGALLNTLALGPLIAGLAALSEPGGLSSGMLLVAAGVVAGAAFIRRELRAQAPMLPVDLLRMPVFRLSLATSVCAFAATTMALVALPFYLQAQLGQSALEVGLVMTCWPLASTVVAPFAGRLSDRTTPTRMCVAGMVTLGAALLSFSWMAAVPSMPDLAWRLILCGIGFALFQSPNNRIIIGSAPHNRSGGASGLQSLGRLLGQSLGATMASGVLALAGSMHALAACLYAAVLALAAAAASSRR